MSRHLQTLRSGWITARDLLGGLLIGIALGGVLDEVMKFLPVLPRRAISALAAAGVLGVAGSWWGRHMAYLAGVHDERNPGRTAAIAFGPSVVLIGLALAALEPRLVARGADAGWPIHVVFTLLFVPAALVIAAIGGFALGFGMRDLRLGATLAIRAGLSAALAFLIINVIMDALGWRVGGPNAAQRGTMLVVTALSSAAAALAAGSAIGHRLFRNSLHASPPHAAG
jgi:hypothetical protein